MKKSKAKNILYSLILCSQISTLKAAIYEPATIWNKNKINVCFLDEQHQLEQTALGTTEESFKKNGFTPAFLTLEEKEIIKTTINNTFYPSITGIHFVGWKNCSQESMIDVIIMKAGKVKGLIFNKKAPFKGFASIGENGLLTKEGYIGKKLESKALVALQVFDPAVIVHEFGHIAGLRHEHIHPEAKKIDSGCHSALYSKESPINDSVLTTYDRASIMNYCRINNHYTKTSALSALDRETLLKIYSNH